MTDLIANTTRIFRESPLHREISSGNAPSRTGNIQTDQNAIFKEIMRDTIGESTSINTWKNPHLGESGKMLDQIMEMQSANRLAQKLQQITQKPVVTASYASKSYAMGKGMGTA
ncbi:MAG: hypothetical protein HQL07_03650 [Nitrospirae bacterium]|nr:hypothetical protein [Magnetococcales bacterium]HAT50972.1 hypothetical protein [Alphaproteobacteria bacterium]